MPQTSHPNTSKTHPPRTPIVVQYLYVHGPGESFDYPSSRSQRGSGQLAARYLECVLTQAATLLLRDVDCRVALVTNVTDRSALGRHGASLLDAVERLGVEVMFAEYLHRPTAEVSTFAASRYVFDAILAAVEHVADDTQMWMVDVDCVWRDPPGVLASAPTSPGIGCIQIRYPPDWDLYGFTPHTMGELAESMGAPEGSLRWVGGELLTGSAADMRALAASCESLEQELAAQGRVLTTEEQLLSLAAALGRVSLLDMSEVAQRIWTGPRHGAPAVTDAGRLGLWHLPAEKGLGFRRAAREVSSGRTSRLVRDLESPARAMRRFNVLGAGGWRRRVRDDLWLVSQRLLDRLLTHSG
jgi:hypothetical protein